MGADYDSMNAMWRFVGPTLAFLTTLLAALVLRWLLKRSLQRVIRVPDALAACLKAVRVPSLLWAAVVAIWVAIEVSELSRRVTAQLEVAFQVALILSVTLTASSLVAAFIGLASERRALGGPVTGLAQTGARVTILVVGLLVLLSVIGIHITPILTALGVGGLAVALALQDTLANLFAGIHLLADRPIHVGDYVRIADSIEGNVVDIGWRSTRVRMLQNTVVVVPNKKVAESVIVNYDLPEPRMALLVRVSVGYESDADRVERVLVDEATRAAGQVPGLLAEPAPLARLIPGFGDSSLDFTVVCHVARFVDQFPVQHELRKRILRRLRAEAIDIPYPTRTVELRPSGSGRPLADEREQQ
jgi:small-conductance mechanosensitive channel